MWWHWDLGQPPTLSRSDSQGSTLDSRAPFTSFLWRTYIPLLSVFYKNLVLTRWIFKNIWLNESKGNICPDIWTVQCVLGNKIIFSWMIFSCLTSQRKVFRSWFQPQELQLARRDVQVTLVRAATVTSSKDSPPYIAIEWLKDPDEAYKALIWP